MTTTLFVNTFRGYSYSRNLAHISVSMPMKMQTARSPGSSGEFSAGSLLGPRTVTIEGVIADDTNNPPTILGFRAAQDAFAAVHAEGTAGKFYVHSDRYLNAEVQSLVYAQDEGYGNVAYTATLYCADPFWYSDAVTTVTLSAGNNPISSVGLREVLPVVSLTVQSGADGVQQVVFSDDRGNTMSITPAAGFTGNIVVDCLKKTISANSVPSSTIFGGSFLVVDPSSSVSMTVSSGLVLTGSPSLTYQDRWV